MPPPCAGPVMAAMIGCGSARIAGTRSDIVSMARIAILDSGRPSMLGGAPESSRSSPEQKARPAPVRRTTWQSFSAPTSRNASYRGSTTSNDIALSRSGRFRVMSFT